MYFKEASKRMNEELDVSNILITIRNMKLFMSVILCRNQKLMLELQKGHVLQPEERDINSNKVGNEQKIIEKKEIIDGFTLVDHLNSKLQDVKSEGK